MAKRGEGTPSLKRDEERRRHLSRAEREKRMERIILIVGASLVAVVALLIIIGIVFEVAIRPNQAVAKVGDETIKAVDFEQRAKYQRVQLMLNLSYCQSLSEDSIEYYFSCQNASQWETMLSSFISLGSDVLDTMIEEEIIRQEAEARGITVSEEAVQEEIQTSYGYAPSSDEAEPTTEPTATATPRYTATPTNTPTSTATPTLAGDDGTPTLTPSPTLPPTSTPTPAPTLTDEEALDQFEQQYTLRFDTFKDLTGISEETYREIRAESYLLYEAVFDAVTAEVPTVTDQVRVRQIRVTTEDEAIEILEALRDGESFAELAQNSTATRNAQSPSSTSGGELGWLPADQLTSAVTEAVFAAEVGEIVGPIFEIDMENMQADGSFSSYYYITQVLGHEVRPVDESILSQQHQEYFDNWLTGVKAEKVEEYDRWTDRVPEEPTDEEVNEALTEEYEALLAMEEES